MRRVIDTSGNWWKGEGFDDLKEYLAAFTSQTYVAEEIRQSFCKSCGGDVFGLSVDSDEGCVQRVCCSCAAPAIIGDGEDSWGEASPEAVLCPCGAGAFQVGVGFSLIDSGEVRWITVGVRCTTCGVLGACADWKIDYQPSRQLLDMV